MANLHTPYKPINKPEGLLSNDFWTLVMGWGLKLLAILVWIHLILSRDLIVSGSVIAGEMRVEMEVW